MTGDEITHGMKPGRDYEIAAIVHSAGGMIVVKNDTNGRSNPVEAHEKVFVLEVLQVWIDPARKHPRTLHHLGKGRFVIDGRTIALPSRMKRIGVTLVSCPGADGLRATGDTKAERE